MRLGSKVELAEFVKHMIEVLGRLLHNDGPDDLLVFFFGGMPSRSRVLAIVEDWIGAIWLV